MFLHKHVSIYKVFSAIDERENVSPDCKYKHMLENGAPPVKVGVLYRLLHIEFQQGRCFRVNTLKFMVLNSISFYTDSMGPMNYNNKM